MAVVSFDVRSLDTVCDSFKKARCPFSTHSSKIFRQNYLEKRIKTQNSWKKIEKEKALQISAILILLFTSKLLPIGHH